MAQESLPSRYSTHQSKYSVFFDKSESKKKCLREEFTVKEVAISLFDCSGSGGPVPRRDACFDNTFDRNIRYYGEECNLDQVIEKAKSFYGGVGRFVSTCHF